MMNNLNEMKNAKKEENIQRTQQKMNEALLLLRTDGARLTNNFITFGRDDTRKLDVQIAIKESEGLLRELSENLIFFKQSTNAYLEEIEHESRGELIWKP